MEPAQEFDSQKPKQPVSAAPPVVSKRPSRLKNMLARTSNSFTAEYSIFLVLLGVTLSNLTGLVYVFFGLIVDTMQGAGTSSFLPLHMFALWLMISSVVTLPITYILWSRVQGELASGDGELPKGAAKGFRTFWIIVSVLSMVGLTMAALYAPIAAAIEGSMVPQMLLSVTLPSLIGVALNGVGIYMVTRGAGQQKLSRVLLLLVAALTVVLFITDYAWASSTQKSAPDRPATPTYPSRDYDVYDDLYDDPYNQYTVPEDYR